MPGNTVCLDVEMSAENCPASKKKICSSGLEHVIKVRKPYTITKPRERWTKEEHNKFLEALKLYGRAWRQIEEHVGTKTAVQIRSHAQKFFTKVVRETTGDDSGQVKNIEIPPPRPKKKPLHPYPRKLGNSLSIPMAKKHEWSSTPYISSSEQANLSMPELSLHAQDNMSPTTVLSVVGSDTIGSPASDPMSRCTSPASSVIGSDPAQSTTSVDNENSLFQLKSDMGLDSGAYECIPWKEASPSMEPPASTLKLFGKTVVVADPQKQNVATGARAVQSDEGQTKWNSWPIGVTPMLCLFPSHGGLPNSFEGGVVPLPCLWASNLTTATPNFCLEQDQLPICGVFSDGGGADFKAAPSPEARIGSGSSNAVSDGVQNSSLKFKPSEISAFRILKAPLSKAAAGKGFVPYRRCVAERKENNHNRVDGCSEGQQLCLSVGD